MKRLLLLISFLLGNFAILLVSLFVLTIYASKQSSADQTPTFENVSAFKESYTNFSALPSFASGPTAQIVAGDARQVLVDDFFRQYHSPMTGLGQIIVTTADKYQIPFGLLPAIAQCEGNVGKVMPENSYNPYGYGIYGDKVTRFDSWATGIETVSKTLRQDYFDFGLNTPDKIMTKYTPSSNGSWAFCVNKFMAELH